MKTFKYVSQLLVLLLAFNTIAMADIYDKSAAGIESDANKALAEFYKEVAGSKAYLQKVKGYVVFSDVVEAGFFIGGKYGEGVLRIKDKSQGFYRITAASAGMLAGATTYSLVIAITTDAALKKFMSDDDWENEVDVNMALATWNSEEELDDIDFGNGLIGFVFDSKGLLGNFTLEGTKFKKFTP